MAKITNRLEEIKYWNKKRAEGVKKAQEKKKSQPIVYKQKKQIPIRKRSKKQSGRLVKYLRIRDKWFKDPTNQYCKLNMRPDCTKEDPRPSSDVHHEKGTIGELLFDTRFWRPGCRWCHRIAHDNDQEARDKGNIKSRHTIGKPMLAVVILKKMRKVQILKDWSTGTYFTNDYECWWSRDVSDAYQYGVEQDLSKVIENLLLNDFDNPLNGKNYIELVFFYCR